MATTHDLVSELYSALKIIIQKNYGKSGTEETAQRLLACMPKSRLFVFKEQVNISKFSYKNKDGEVQNRLKRVEPLDLPFDHVIFEDQFCAICVNRTKIDGCTAYDYGLIYTKDGELDGVGVYTIKVGGEHIADIHTYSHIRCYVEEILNKELLFKSPIGRKIKPAFGKPIKINTVVRVKNEKIVYTEPPKSSGETRDFSHRFEVRGHWRTVRGFGHDSEGRPVPGKTWVKDHVKGPDDKPLVKKYRAVLGEHNERSSHP